MKPSIILVRCGEMTLKGRNRARFENTMLKHIRKALVNFPRIELSKAYGRIYVQLNGEPYEDAANQLRKVFGIVSFSPVALADLSLDSIRQTALEMIRSLERLPATFKVSVRRPNKDFEYDSQEMNRLVGGYVLQHLSGLRVDVHRPEVELQVEIREDRAYVFCEKAEGLGGFPYGSNGKAMLMLSGGIDSPVAGWLSMRKGLEIEAVHFHSFPYTSERAQQKVVDLTYRLAEYAEVIRLHMVPFTEIQTRLNQSVQPNLLITLMRRAMMRITEKLAFQREAGAIITGESLGQVASQTLPSLKVINEAASLPILRPLIMMDKNDIIRIAERIETFPISILPYEDCCTLFVPKSPSTNPNIKVVRNIERGLDWLEGAIEEAAENAELLVIKQGEKAVSISDDLF
jgi:thiamine biosynthesis protein ThiI